MARKALERDELNAFAHVVLGRILTLAGEMDRALRHLEIAVELNPGFSQAYFGLAWALYWSGRPKDALDNVDIAFRLNPRDPMASFFLTLKACCFYWLGKFKEAEVSARRGAQLSDREAWSRLALATALVAQDRLEEATQAVSEARRIDPQLTLASFAAIVGRVPAEVRDPMFTALGKAGLA
jgi:tetratricopeptide (TPR) repeat protein